MNFKIYYEGLLVAQFMLKDDRDICLELLQHVYLKLSYILPRKKQKTLGRRKESKMSEDSVEVKDNVSYVETGRDIRRTLMDIMLYIDADTRYATSAALAEMLALLIKRNTK